MITAALIGSTFAIVIATPVISIAIALKRTNIAPGDILLQVAVVALVCGLISGVVASRLQSVLILIIINSCVGIVAFVGTFGIGARLFRVESDFWNLSWVYNTGFSSLMALTFGAIVPFAVVSIIEGDR